MPQPPAYTRSFDFAPLAPSNVPTAGTRANAEYDALAATANAIRSNLARIQRDDGLLANATVTIDTLAPSVRALMGAGWQPKGDWVTATAYIVKDVVTHAGYGYVCMVAHTAGVFATDLAASKWALLFSTDLVPADGSVTAAMLADITPTGAAQANGIETLFTRGERDVRFYGVTMDGSTDDTAAWAAAIQSGQALYVPPGTSKCAASAFSGVNYVRIRGAGRRLSVIKVVGTTVGWTFSNCQDVHISHLGFAPNTIAATALRFDTGSGIGTIERCQFAAFTANGVEVVGTAIAPLSGFTVRDNLFLSNAGKQLFFRYSNDFWIDNNQFGISGAHPAHGCYLDNSSAGTYTKNYHWDNVIGFETASSSYLRINCNRFEESDRQGVVLTGGVDVQFSDNHLHTNSKSSFGTYDSCSFVSMTRLVAVGNQTYDFSAGVYAHAFSYSFSTGNSRITFKDNQASGYNTQPIFVDSSLNAVDWNVDEVLRFSSNVTIAAGASVAMGEGAADATPAVVVTLAGRKCVAVRMYAQSVAVPGGGQTFTYTLVRNGVATISATTSGGAAFSSSIASGAVALAQGDEIYINVATSAGAAVTRHRVTIALADY